MGQRVIIGMLSVTFAFTSFCCADGATADDGGECVADPATASGAYTGVAVCPNGNQRTVDLMIYQEPGDDDIDGTVNFDWSVRYMEGLFDVTVEHVIRTQIVDGELDRDGNISGRLLSETVWPTASAPDFVMNINADQTEPQPTTWRGTISQVNSANEPVVTCEVVMAALGTELPELPLLAGDGGTAD